MRSPAGRSLRARAHGLTLVEMLVALFLGSVLILGLVHIVSAASAAGSLQRNQAQIEEHARHAAGMISRTVRQAGFRPEPWNPEFAIDALGAESADDVRSSGDRLAIRGWSDLNCFDNRNPDLDGDGHPRFYLRESVFDVNGEGNLTLSCRYGPTPAGLTVQITRQGVVPGVESFQVMYGEDGDGDGNVERWVHAGEWDDREHVMGVQVGLLLSSSDAVTAPSSQRFDVLGTPFRTAPDGRLRRVFEFAVAIRGRRT